jgi:hypothetical protein
MPASPKLAPPEAPAPKKRAPRPQPVAELTAEDKVRAAKRAELVRELKGIGLLLFGLFLAAALAAVGFASLRDGFNANGAVGIIGKILVQPIVWLFGWPAAVLAPLVPVVHALRLFGRLDSDSDRSWMIFFAGIVLLLPIALGLSFSSELPYWNEITGMWGGVLTGLLVSGFGQFGAWVVWFACMSLLMAVTLRWNPIRMIVGRRRPAVVVGFVADEKVVDIDAAAPKKRKRKPKPEESAVDLALALEPPPEEMPAIDIANDRPLDVAAEEPKKKKRKLSKSEVAKEHAAEIAAAIASTANPADAAGLANDELPSPELLTPAPARNAEQNQRALDLAGQKLM